MYGIKKGTKAKNIDLGKLEGIIQKTYFNIVDRMEEEGLKSYIKSGYKKRLELLDIEINNKLRSSSGQAVWNIGKDKYKIQLHKDLYTNKGKKHKSLLGTIKHEIIHILTLKSDSDNDFKYICDKLDIEKHHYLDFDTKESYKYKTYCKECGKLTGKRKRKSKIIKKPHLYHSTCCNADIRVEKI